MYISEILSKQGFISSFAGYKHSTFVKTITALRKEKKISQDGLAKLINTSTLVIGRYERDEMPPSIEAAREITKILGTTVGYLKDGTEQENLF